MAKGRVSGGTGLNMKANLDINQAKKNALDYIKVLNNIRAAASASGVNPSTTSAKVYDVKPLNEYQAGLLKIKQEALDLAKQNAAKAEERRAQLDAEKKAAQEKAAAEKSASLATQAALKEESRLRREEIELQKQAKAEANKRKPTQVSNSQAEIDASNRSAQGTMLYTSAINAQVVARAKLNAEAARTAVANGTLTTSTTSYTSAAGQQTEAVNKVVLSKKQLAQMLAEEKLKQANATAELKINAREMLNAKGSIDQRKAALDRLVLAYKRMSVAERESASGNRMAGIISRVRDQVKELEGATKNSGSGLSDFFDTIKSNILSTLGPIALIMAAWNAAKELFSHNVEISDNFVDVQRTAKLSGDEVDRLGDKLKKINTRTNLEGLLDIGFEGGRLGVAKDDLVGFITTVDQLAVVLKKELPGGAEAVAESLGKIVKIYKVSENEGISLGDAMNKVGSSLLELAHSGGVTVKYLQDFTLGVAGTAVSAKLSLPVIEAYGAVMSTAGTIASSASISLTRVVNDLSSKRGKYFAIAQLEDSTLTIDKFNNLINTDTQAALSLFFKGLKAGNPTQIEFNDRIKSVGINTGKVNNAVKVLANNFDLLQGKLEIGTKGFSEATSVSHNFELANNSLAASFDKIKNSISNAFTSSSFSRSLGDLLNLITDNRTESEKLTERFNDNKHSTEELNKSLDPLVNKYDELKSKGKLNRDEQTELRNIIQKIGELMPEAISQFGKYNNALDINRKKVEDLTKSQKDLMELQNRDALKSSNKEFTDLTTYLVEAKKYALLVSKEERGFMDKVSDLTGGDVRKKRIQDANDIVTEVTAKSIEAAKRIRELGGVLTKAQKDLLDYDESTAKAKNPIKKSEVLGTGELADETEVPRTTELIKAEIKALQEADKKLAITSDEFKSNIAKIKILRKELKMALNGGVDPDLKKEDTRLKNAYARAKSLSNEIIELQKSSVRKSKSSDQEELDSVTDKYQKMKEKIKAFYADNENRGSKIQIDGKKYSENQVIGLINANSKIESDAVQAKQKARKQLEELDIEKKQYEDYEKYKAEFGQQAADKQYDKLISSHKTYLARLDEEIKKINDIPEADRIGAQIDQLPELNKRKDEVLDIEKQKNSELLSELRSFNQLKLARTDKYYADLAKLGKDATLQQINDLHNVYAQDVDGYADAAFAKTDIAKRLSEEVLVLTRSQIKEQIKALVEGYSGKEIPASVSKVIENLKSRLSLGSDQANLDEYKVREQDIIAAMNAEADKASPKFNGLIKQLAEIRKLIKGTDSAGTGKANTGLKKFLSDLGGNGDNAITKGAIASLGYASEAVGVLGEGLQDTNAEAAYTLDTIAKLGGAAADLGTAILSGKPDQIISASIKAVGTLFSIGKKTREMNAAARKEVADYYSNAIAGEREYQDLLANRQLDNVRNNKIALQGIRDEVALRKQQIDAYSKESIEIMGKLQGQSFIQSEEYKHGTWFKKAQVNKTYGSLAGKSFAELSQLLAQGKLEGDTKALVERLKELEQKGYDAEKAIADLAKQTSELFTGTNADTLTNSLADMFKSGKTSAKDLADFFKQSMDDAALSIFKNKVLSAAIENFYKEFDAAAQSGDELTSDEVARLNGLFTNLTTDALKKFEEFKKITGSDLKGSSDNTGGSSSVGTIRAELTEQTGGKLEGLFRGTFDMTKTLVGLSTDRNAILIPMAKSLGDFQQVALEQLRTQMRIDANTLRTADNTEPLKGMSKQLDQIISNTKGGPTARGAGYQSI